MVRLFEKVKHKGKCKELRDEYIIVSSLNCPVFDLILLISSKVRLNMYVKLHAKSIFHRVLIQYIFIFTEEIRMRRMRIEFCAKFQKERDGKKFKEWKSN